MKKLIFSTLMLLALPLSAQNVCEEAGKAALIDYLYESKGLVVTAEQIEETDSQGDEGYESYVFVVTLKEDNYLEYYLDYQVSEDNECDLQNMEEL